LLWRFPCSYATSSSWRTPPLKSPESLRGTLNLSPKPSPRLFTRCWSCQPLLRF
jgi:hypothetical protein